MAEDRLLCWRWLSISLISSDSVLLHSAAISFMPVQNASSRLTLVLCPLTTIERFTTGDFMLTVLDLLSKKSAETRYRYAAAKTTMTKAKTQVMVVASRGVALKPRLVSAQKTLNYL